jgi:hypothetical protein
MPYMLPMKPLYIGRFSKGTLYARMIKAPEKMPADPKPATARPMMSVKLELATPQIKLPSSKMPMATRYVHLTLKYE